MQSDEKQTPQEITELLSRWGAGDREAERRLFEIVYPELRKLARRYMRGERHGHILQTTALVNESYIKLIGAKSVDWQNRRHFFALAARAMRRLLVDYARKPHPHVVPIEDFAEEFGVNAGAMELALAIDRLLGELEAVNSEQCAIVELKFFLSMTDEEAADALQLPLRTAQRRWLEARRWLFERLDSEKCIAEKANKTTAS